ncbi:MBL fold metallo-hydrolase [Aquimarina addita]|uniref:MBL fold metallo-hydrolase n=2 Tax=Aquimarina addita TaxID=870485 RepID=A0ABP7XEP9_9FLAO
MLGEKGSFGFFPWTEDRKMNPLVNLPFTKEDLTRELEAIDAVIVSHLHPDHWDEAAIRLLDKTIPLICPNEIASKIRSFGFSNVKEISNFLSFRGVKIHLTSGQHGTGEIGNKMGKVNGFVLNYLNNNIYITGDTIWCKEVQNTINKYHPKHIIVAGGAATFSFGNPVTMTSDDIKNIASFANESKIWITHLEAISPCKENRSYLIELLKSFNLEKQCRILKDGEKSYLINYRK